MRGEWGRQRRKHDVIQDRGSSVLAALILLSLPVAAADAGKDLGAIPRIVLPPVDVTQALAEDPSREAAGLAPRFALPVPVKIDTRNAGVWEEKAGLSTWRLLDRLAGSAHSQPRFHALQDARGGSLVVSSADGKYGPRPFTDRTTSPTASSGRRSSRATRS